MKDFKINVLGTEYDVLIRSSKDDPWLMDRGAYIDRSVKKIVISTKDEHCEIDDYDYIMKQYCRHEIIHAFMEESGLSYNMEHKRIGIEETMIDWMAIQFPKIIKIFKEHDLL